MKSMMLLLLSGLQVKTNKHSLVAQLAEQATVNRQVPGSSPGWGASMKGIIMEKEIQEIDFTNGTEMPELTAAQICSLENPEYCEACQ